MGILIIFLIICPLTLFGATEALKERIAEKEAALRTVVSEGEKSELFYQLSIAYYQDQEIEKAFGHFLEALKFSQKKRLPKWDKKEFVLYTQALDDYLAHAGHNPIEEANTLIERYGETANQNPHYLHLNFLIATAYANLGKYDCFFEKFFRGYPFLQETFLAYKTRGVLYLRLAQHSRFPEERRKLKQEAFQCLTTALQLGPKDASLYKILIGLAKDEGNNELILCYLQKVTGSKTMIPRSDIYFYVREAAALKEFDLGQKVIDQAKEHYDYSRALLEAQDYLNQFRGKDAGTDIR